MGRRAFFGRHFSLWKILTITATCLWYLISLTEWCRFRVNRLVVLAHDTGAAAEVEGLANGEVGTTGVTIKEKEK